MSRKIVFQETEHDILMGITMNGSDPVSHKFEEVDLLTLFLAKHNEVAAVIVAATDQLEKNPKNPAYKAPKPEKKADEKPKKATKPAKKKPTTNEKPAEDPGPDPADKPSDKPIAPPLPLLNEDKPEETPAEPPDNAGKKGIYLATGEGPFEDIQKALDALGIDKENRPKHNRYSRLSQDLKSKIQVF